MSDFVGAFMVEMMRYYHYGIFTFNLLDVFYACIILSIIGSFIEHFVRAWLDRA